MLLFHHPMSASSRFVRLVLSEYGETPELQLEQPWDRRPEFMQMNPAGTLPVMTGEANSAIVGAFAISEYLDETRGPIMRGRRLMPDTPPGRAEVRRLIDWFLVKTEADVTRALVRERVFKVQMSPAQGGGAPDSAVLRAARANIRQHMRYLGWLAQSRDWLAGDGQTYADLAAAATVSVLDYLGEIDWNAEPAARDWYQRMKSRPSFRDILSDRVRGLPPVSHYSDLDF
ncbi:glutathione S-transferase family protein [Oricola cellulosilytica]|uniref:Glutathione S-transferase family protein n=1 Tax=Oricola cellulosilytica TaxID=1429082 RepID=A0A4R0PKL7_9HYPH|nr:glutathione S-transferase family protein [Oricola cellulosilytica]TCD16109.1 glutathione S-transferase family protein [Oricola cellulosilytica]